MTGRCRDCGVVYETPYYGGIRKVCPECMALRGRIVDAMKANKFTKETFTELQRKIASNRGTAAKAMRSCLEELQASR